MVTQKGINVASQITGVPPAIKQKYQSVTLCIVTSCLSTKYHSCWQYLADYTSVLWRTSTIDGSDHPQRATQSARSIQTTRLPRHNYTSRSRIRTSTGSHFGHIQFNFCAQNEHVPEIERFIRTVKDRACSGYNFLRFKCIPRLILIQLVSNSAFWLNAVLHRDGASSTLSPRYLLTGKRWLAFCGKFYSKSRIFYSWKGLILWMFVTSLTRLFLFGSVSCHYHWLDVWSRMDLHILVGASNVFELWLVFCLRGSIDEHVEICSRVCCFHWLGFLSIV